MTIDDRIMRYVESRDERLCEDMWGEKLDADLPIICAEKTDRFPNLSHDEDDYE